MQTFPAYLLFIRTALTAMKRFPAPFLAGQASTGISSYLRSRASGLYAVVERLVRQSIHRLSRFTALLVLLKVSFAIDVEKKKDHTEVQSILRSALMASPIVGGTLYFKNEASWLRVGRFAFLRAFPTAHSPLCNFKKMILL